MALNLWKLAGRSTAFNPLPVTGYPFLSIGIGEYVLRFKARSMSSQLALIQLGNGVPFLKDELITPSLKLYEYTFNSKVQQNLLIASKTGNSVHDIEIQDIELVQKPLPKMTINGIDGFLSGKWLLHANAKVIDDETLELNATAIAMSSSIVIDGLPNQDYTFTIETNQAVKIESRDSSGISLLVHNDGVISNGKFSFKSHANAKQIRVALYNNSTGLFTFKRPQLNLGTTPVPFAKKTGDRMVKPVPKKNLFDGRYDTYANANTRTSLNISCKPNTPYTVSGGNVNYTWFLWNAQGVRTDVLTGVTITTKADTVYFKCYYLNEVGYVGNPNDAKIQIEEGITATPYEPYAVQMNPKPKRLVPKKNLFDGVLELGSISSSTGGLNAGSSSVRNANKISIKPNTTHFISNDKGYTVAVYYYDLNDNFISTLTLSGSFTTPLNARYLRFRSSTTLSENDLTTKFQLEEGSTATAYEPYSLVLPPAKKGLAFDGAYLQLPSMTMDSIEIDCLIDSSKLASYLFDARNGLANGWVYNTPSLGSGISSVSGFKVNERTKIRINAISPFTDDVNIFSRFDGNEKTKGILYNIKCFLNGSVVAEYDFTNPNNIIGDKVIPNAKNLIPSFEDSKWSLHANFKVLGKDVGRLEATTSDQSCKIPVTLSPNTNYLIDIVAGRIAISDGANINANNKTPLLTGRRTFNSGSDVNNLHVFLRELSTGSFDFIKPQLYELSGKEGTLFGNPKPLQRSAKRQLYAKR